MQTKNKNSQQFNNIKPQKLNHHKETPTKESTERASIKIKLGSQKKERERNETMKPTNQVLQEHNETTYKYSKEIILNYMPQEHVL